MQKPLGAFSWGPTLETFSLFFELSRFPFALKVPTRMHLKSYLFSFSPQSFFGLDSHVCLAVPVYAYTHTYILQHMTFVTCIRVAYLNLGASCTHAWGIIDSCRVRAASQATSTMKLASMS